MTASDSERPSAAERPPGITCASYERGDGRRCVHYVANGGCALPSEFMCSEWAKREVAKGRVTRPAPPPVLATPNVDPTPAPRDLFGNPVRRSWAAPSNPPGASTTPIAPSPKAHASTIDVDQLRGLTSDDIDAFKATGLEVRLRSESIGDFWLVPEYTSESRLEITPEHAATLLRVLSAFPDARVAAFQQSPTSKRRARLASKEAVHGHHD